MYSLFSSDIQKLNTLYNRPQFSFVFLYGRYGTGKTQLVREFCKGKPALFFTAQEMLPSRALETFHREVVHSLHPAKKPAPFTNWTQAFSYISDISFTHRLIFVLDEFQYLMQRDPSFAEAFTYAVHHSFPTGKIFLIVTSSAPAYAKSLMEAPVTPPFEAVTARARLERVPFYTCQPYFSGYTPIEQLTLYGITGGLPANLLLLDPKRTADENIISAFFHRDSPLLFLPQTWLHRELREISTYNLLLEIIANDCARLADIAAAADIGTNKCAKYLNVLIDLGLLKKEFPAAGDVQKRVRYIFADHMMRFWYRFVFPNISSILFNRGEHIYTEYVKPQLYTYLRPVFESVCADYLERLAAAKQTPFAYHHTGSWWCGGTKREPFFRIPLVAADETHTVLGACHCDTTPADTVYLENLLRPLEPFGNRKRYCCIFSVSGFTQPLTKAAANTGNVWLIGLEDMV